MPKTILAYSKMLYSNSAASYKIASTLSTSSSFNNSSYFGNTFVSKNNTTFQTGSQAPKTLKSKNRPYRLCQKPPCQGSIEIEGFTYPEGFMECFGSSGQWTMSGAGGYIGFINKTNNDVLLKRMVYNVTYGYGFIQYFDIYACTSSYSTMPNEYIVCYDWKSLVAGMERKIQSSCELINIYLSKFTVNPISGNATLTAVLQKILNNIQYTATYNEGTSSGGKDYSVNVANFGLVTVEVGHSQNNNTLTINLSISSPNVINGTQQIFGASALVNTSANSTTVTGSFTNFSGWATSSILTTDNTFRFQRN